MFAYANVRLHEERDVITAKHTHPQLANWLLSTKLNSIPLPRHGRIITLRSTDTVSHAIKVCGVEQRTHISLLIFSSTIVLT